MLPQTGQRAGFFAFLYPFLPCLDTNALSGNPHSLLITSPKEVLPFQHVRIKLVWYSVNSRRKQAEPYPSGRLKVTPPPLPRLCFQSSQYQIRRGFIVVSTRIADEYETGIESICCSLFLKEADFASAMDTPLKHSSSQLGYLSHKVLGEGSLEGSWGHTRGQNFDKRNTEQVVRVAVCEPLKQSEKPRIVIESRESLEARGRVEVVSPRKKEFEALSVPVENEEPVRIPDVPNGGYGWVIVFASFSANAIINGIVYTFGVFLPTLTLDFHETRGKTAWVGSLIAGLYFSVGLGFGLVYLPSIVVVSNWFDTRRALATGIATCGAGVGTFIFAPLGNFLLEEYGWRGAYLIYTGILLNCLVLGLLMREPPMKKLQPVPEQPEFPIGDPANFTHEKQSGPLEQRSKFFMKPEVNSNPRMELVGTSSTPVNSMQKLPMLPRILETREFPPLQNFSTSSNSNNSKNNVKTVTSSIHSPISGTLKPAALSMSSIKPEFLSPLKKGSHKNIRQTESVPTLSRKHDLRRTVSTSFYKIKTVLSKHYSTQPPGSHLTFPQRMLSAQSPLASKLSRISFSRQASIASQSSGSRQTGLGSVHLPLARKDTFLTGSVQRLPQFQRSTSVEEYRASVLSIQQKDTIDEDKSPPQEVHPEKDEGCRMLPASFVDIFREMTDFSLLKNPVFLLIGLSNIFVMLGFYAPFVYLVDAAIKKGIGLGSANFLLSAVGLSNTVGRVLMGWLSDLPRVDSCLLNALSLLVSGVTVVFTPFCNTMVGFTAVALLFGLCIAGFMSVTSIMLVEFLGIESLTNAFGLILLFRGLASFLGAPIAGAISEATGSYDASFYTGGGFLILASLVGFTVYLPMFASYRTPLGQAGPHDLEGTPEGNESKTMTQISEKNINSSLA
ncbi:unnamed protein product [Darwinula stevensoni]|uniref:Major facilitator superfamily (MFS) profile domain-containing protein n=1 Tax=Darwinula stevensoni TaxID=69355 RepID=A0A7R9A413_9CRUS|nr:unnamed protein product [Darwinula stevensoni]CAG0889078.1 unnamed protein product [Darwinula stevensoni]